jgi:hypothetical protein
MNINAKRNTKAIPLLLVFLFVFSLQGTAQEPDNIPVTIRASNKPLHAVLDDLAEQSGYNFTFDARLTDSRRRINMTIRDIPLSGAIDTLFQQPGLVLRVINRNIVIFPGARKMDQAADSTDASPGVREVTGTINDLRTGKPLPYASLGVVDTYFGTISNEDGSFLLRLPDTLQQPILVASYIGYRNQYSPVGLYNNEPVEIRMNKNYISLQEVIIRYQDPVSLLHSALGKIGENYLDQPAGMQAYYREKVIKDDKYMIFSEAVVDIAKPPYQGSLFQERSRLLKGRKLTNIALEDTVVFKISSGLKSMLQLDIIKHPPGFLSEDFVMVYDLYFSDVVSFKDRLVYVISFEQKPFIDETLFRGDIYIDREDLAILAADFEYDPVRLSREEDMFVEKKSRQVRIRPTSASYHVEYRKSADLYHLSQVQGEVKFKVRKKRQWIASRYQINLEMAVTKVNPGNPPRIRFGEQLKPSTIISDEVFAYDPDFWGSYNTISPETNLKEALKQIEKAMLEINE